MNILIITQMYSQPDDVGENKPTKTVNYFARDWAKAGNNVIVIHCSSQFPSIYYHIPSVIKNKISGSTSNIIPPIESRKPLHRKEGSVKVYRIPMLKYFPGQAFSHKRINATAKKICSIVSHEHFVPDLVAGHFANPSAILVSVLSQKFNAKSSIVFHHDCIEKNLEKYRLLEAAKNIKAIGTRSVIEAHEVKELLNLKKLPFVCCSGVPNEVVDDSSMVCEKHDYSNQIKYIYVGSLIQRKHVDSVILAFNKLHGNDNKSQLYIVGGGPEEDALKKVVSDCNSKDNIHILGRIPRDEVMIKMKEAHVFTLISDNEVFGMVYIEAMLQGCLVIASKGGGFDGIIIDGVNGFLCNPGDTKMLEQIYLRIENMSVIERNEIGRKAIETAKHYSEKEVAEKYMNDVLSCQGREKE